MSFWATVTKHGSKIRLKFKGGSVTTSDKAKLAQAAAAAQAHGGTVVVHTTSAPGDAIIAQARKHLGVTEHPAGSNSGPEVSAWLKRVGCPDHNPWCAAFASCMVNDAGIKFDGSAGCGTLRERAIAAGRWTQHPQPGYIGIIAPDEHAVIVLFSTGSTVCDISGNTSAANGNDYNGGTVAIHNHPISLFSGFIKTY